jgi:hypothetical protein
MKNTIFGEVTHIFSKFFAWGPRLSFNYTHSALWAFSGRSFHCGNAICFKVRFKQCCGSGRIRTFLAGSDPAVWDRIRILSVINGPILTFLVSVKALNTYRISVSYFFGSWLYFLKHISAKKVFGRNLAENLFRSGSGSGRLRKSDPDPVKNRPDLQHWL